MTDAATSDLRQIEDLSARLRESEAECAAKDAFIAAISRELNNPLAPVLLAVEHLRLLLKTGDAVRLESAMQMLERATSGFAKRTRVLLDLVDLTAGEAQLSTSLVDVSSLAVASASEVSEMARLANCTLILAVAPGIAAIANAEALSQVLGHVLANAFRFGAGRPVRLCVQHDPAGAVMVTIADQGPGIDPVKATQLYALPAQTRTHLEPGLGIGMWVSTQLMAAMGGTISVESALGEGAHFHVRLASPHSG